MTTAHVYTWERTGRDARAPFVLASELHFDVDDRDAVAHADAFLSRHAERAEAKGLRFGYLRPWLAVMVDPTDDHVERAVTYSEGDPGAWTAERVRVLALRVENPDLPVTRDRRN